MRHLFYISMRVTASIAMLATSSAAFGEAFNTASSELAVHLISPVFDSRITSGFSATTDASLASFENELSFSDRDLPAPHNLYATAIGTTYGAARAQTAALGVYWQGAVVATEINPLGGAHVRSVGAVGAAWQDTVTAHVDSRPPGASLIVKALAIIEGNFNVSFDQNAPEGRGAEVTASLQLTGNGMPQAPLPNDTWQFFEDRSIDSHHPTGPYADAIDLTISVANDSPLAYSFGMRLLGNARAYSVVPDSGSAGSMSAFFAVDFLGTFKWGGITGVYDAETGELVEDWTITSDSGFDYSQPYTVPEPSTYLMAAMGLVALMFARRRK
jgi:hypothetical protein